MRFSILNQLLLLGLALWLLVPCSALAEEYSIIFSASVQGDTEPCG